MTDGKYAEFLANVETCLQHLTKRFQAQYPGINLMDCVRITKKEVSSRVWATYMFTDECPDNVTLRDTIRSILESCAETHPGFLLANFSSFSANNFERIRG